MVGDSAEDLLEALDDDLLIPWKKVKSVYNEDHAPSSIPYSDLWVILPEASYYLEDFFL
jgi:hypothetical protein